MMRQSERKKCKTNPIGFCSVSLQTFTFQHMFRLVTHFLDTVHIYKIGNLNVI